MYNFQHKPEAAALHFLFISGSTSNLRCASVQPSFLSNINHPHMVVVDLTQQTILAPKLLNIKKQNNDTYNTRKIKMSNLTKPNRYSSKQFKQVYMFDSQFHHHFISCWFLVHGPSVQGLSIENSPLAGRQATCLLLLRGELTVWSWSCPSTQTGVL